MNTIKVSFHCGAFMMARDASGLRSGDKLCVLDSDPAATALRPKFEDGRGAPCFVGCPVAQQKCGRKMQRCFPIKDSMIGKQWRYVIDCKVSDVRDTSEDRKEQP